MDINANIPETVGEKKKHWISRLLHIGDKLKNVIETFKDVMDSIIMKQIICRSKVIFSIPIFHVVFETP